MYIRTYGKNIPDRINLDANDVNVSAYIAYVDDNGIAYFDSECYRPMNAGTLENLYTKGLLIRDADGFYSPISMEWGETGVSIGYTKYNTTTSAIDYKTATGGRMIMITAPVVISIELGDCVLEPSFHPDTLEYTTASLEIADALSFIVLPPNASVEVKLNGVEVTDYAEGLTWAEDENVVTVKVFDNTQSTTYTIIVNHDEEVIVPIVPILSAMSIGNKTLTPSFDPEELTYTMSTEDAEDILTLSVTPEDTEISVKLGDTELTNYSEGITWENGENILTITVGTDAPVVYTVTVTAS